VSEVVEPTFDLVEPRGTRGGEVEVEPRVAEHPPLDPRDLMGGQIVEDQMEVQPLWRRSIQGSQEGEELLGSVALGALPDDRPLGHIEGREDEGREEIGGPTPPVIVGLPLGDSGGG